MRKLARHSCQNCKTAQVVNLAYKNPNNSTTCNFCGKSLFLLLIVLAASLSAQEVPQNESNLSENTAIMQNLSQNQTIGQTVSQSGEFTLNGLFNMTWAEGVASWLNSTLKTGFFSAAFVTGALPILTLLFIYWKWNAVLSFIHSAGQVLIVLLIAYILLRLMGFLG